MPDYIYLIYENRDSVEGRGPMYANLSHGFFTDEDEAWAYADTIPGVMGRSAPKDGWRSERFSDVRVEGVPSRAVVEAANRIELRTKKAELESELKKIEALLKGAK